MSIKLIFPEGGRGRRSQAAFIWRLVSRVACPRWLAGTRAYFHLPSFGEENPFLTLISFSSLPSLFPPSVPPPLPSFPSLLIYVTDMMSSAELDRRCVGELGGGERGGRGRGRGGSVRHSIRRRRMLMPPDFQTNWGRRRTWRRRQRKSHICPKTRSLLFYIDEVISSKSNTET